MLFRFGLIAVWLCTLATTTSYGKLNCASGRLLQTLCVRVFLLHSIFCMYVCVCPSYFYTTTVVLKHFSDWCSLFYALTSIPTINISSVFFSRSLVCMGFFPFSGGGRQQRNTLIYHYYGQQINFIPSKQAEFSKYTF